MIKSSKNWEMKSIVFASLISFVLLTCYPSLSFAQEAAPDKVAPKKIELAQATGGTGATAIPAGAGATAALPTAVIYGIAAGAVILGAGIANSISSGDNTPAAHH